ncbi:YgaP family membrane protein [Halegenticoccus soli]|uniref:YgaP family membrane protein n=1 Tax=Halegenticoccus soli TaxID=1985678 RepID=UPI000C6DCACD|nr:DUF2892 domain-containing protein [Halegenticoccus soli]
MQKNVGGYDRIARFVVGPILLIVGLAAIGGFVTIAAGTLGAVLVAAALVVGAVLTVTAVTQKCPLNRALGIDTYRGPSATEADEEMKAGRPS